MTRNNDLGATTPCPRTATPRTAGNAVSRGALTRRGFALVGGAALAICAGTALSLVGAERPAWAAGAAYAKGGTSELGRAGSSAREGASSSSTADRGALRVVATFYPMYDFARKVGGERVEVSCLVPAGTEPHDWEPSTADIVALQEADAFVYSGAGMESWVDDAVASLPEDGPTVVEASEGIALRTLDEEAEGDGENHDHEGHDHGESGVDPHVWLDPRNAKAQMANIGEALSQADPDGAGDYRANCERWARECDALDDEYRATLSGVSRRSIVVSHEAFGYLCDAYGLEQLPIEGVDADSEPDARRMAQIADFVRANDVRVIFSEELVSPKVAQAIASETGATVRTLNPIEGLTDEQLAAGEDYFSVMRANLEELKEALS